MPFWKQIHATATEKYLSDKQLNTKSLQRALKILQQEAVGDHRTPSSSPEYRTGLAQSLLYKVLYFTITWLF